MATHKKYQAFNRTTFAKAIDKTCNNPSVDKTGTAALNETGNNQAVHKAGNKAFDRPYNSTGKETCHTPGNKTCNQTIYPAFDVETTKATAEQIVQQPVER